MTSLLIGCQTPVPIETEVKVQEFTFTTPPFPDRPVQTWYSDSEWFYLSREEAINLVNWFTELRGYREQMDITFQEIENVINKLTDVRINIE